MLGRLDGARHRRRDGEAAKAFVAVAADLAAEMNAACEFPLPASEEVAFYVRTDAGVITARALEDDLAEGAHALSPLFEAGHAVIGAYRELEQSKIEPN